MVQAYAQATPTKLGQPNQSHVLPPAIVLAKFPFGGFAPETAKRMDVPEYDTDSKLASMIEAWKKFAIPFSALPLAYRWHNYHSDYEHTLTAFSGFGCSDKELSMFVKALQALQWRDDFSRKAGFVLSALINTGPSEMYVVSTRHLDIPVSYIGCHNKKHVVIDGNADECVGAGMETGTLTVLGDVGDAAGLKMRGGNIIIEGSAGSDTGFEMISGKLRVKKNTGIRVGCAMYGGTVLVDGDAGLDAGLEMMGGEIRIGGGIDTIGELISSGKIFVGGKQVYPAPEVV